MTSELRGQRHWRARRLLPLGALFVSMACALLSVPAGASAHGNPGPLQQATPQPSPAPAPEDGTQAVGTPTPEPNIVQQIVRHTITFSSSSLIEAITEAFVELSRKSIDGAVSKVLPAMDGSMVWLTEVDHQGLARFPQFEQAIRGAWSAMLKAALVFAPLVLALAVLAVLGGGGSAVEARAEMITQALQVLVSYASAAVSFYLLSLGIRGSWGLTAFVWSADLGLEIEPARVLLGGVITSLSAYFLGMSVPLFAIYLLFFMVFLILALLGALGLALAATTALLALGVIVAPLMIGLGSIPQFRWLTWTWTRLMTGLLLLPVLNAILLKVASVMQVTMLGSVGGGELGSALLSFFVVAGALSLVIGINYKVGHMVFAPLLEVHRKAFGATKAVAVLAAAGAAVALGGAGVMKAGLGLGGGLGSGPTLGGGGGGSSGSTGIGGGNSSGTAGLGGSSRALPPRAAAAALSGLAGMSGNPVVRGALSAAARGFQNAESDGRRGLGGAGLISSIGVAGSGGVYSVSTQETAKGILGERAAPEAVRQLAARPEFQNAVRSARRHAVGLERAGIPFGDQMKQSGFADGGSYLGALTFQVGHKDLNAAVESAFAEPMSNLPSRAALMGTPTAEARGVLTTMGRRLDELGGGGFPAVGGSMQLLRQTGWWSFNPPANDPSFGRYAQAFLRAGQYLAETGEQGLLASLERAVQMARGDPTREIAPAEHMAKIQAQILDGDFGHHQETLARIFETWRG